MTPTVSSIEPFLYSPESDRFCVTFQATFSRIVVNGFAATRKQSTNYIATFKGTKASRPHITPRKNTLTSHQYI